MYWYWIIQAIWITAAKQLLSRKKHKSKKECKTLIINALHSFCLVLVTLFLGKSYRGRESNPYEFKSSQDFKSCVSTSSTTSATPLGRLSFHLLLKKKAPKSVLKFRAKDESRTRDLNLGKVTLYQLSYFRLLIPHSLVVNVSQR